MIFNNVIIKIIMLRIKKYIKLVANFKFKNYQ